jgi:hypothetical protein
MTKTLNAIIARADKGIQYQRETDDDIGENMGPFESLCVLAVAIGILVFSLLSLVR